MTKSNSKGMFERAKDRWLCAVICMAPHLKCRADRVNSIRNVADLMLMHTSRAKFFKDGDLVAFPSHQRLAFMAGLNEKTVRRAIDDLVELGLIRIKHRFEDSNFFYLIIPAAAEEHSRACLDLLTNPRNRKAPTHIPPVQQDKQDRQDPQQLSRRMDSCDEQTPMNVRRHSDKHSQTNRLSPGNRALTGGNRQARRRGVGFIRGWSVPFHRPTRVSTQTNRPIGNNRRRRTAPGNRQITGGNRLAEVGARGAGADCPAIQKTLSGNAGKNRVKSRLQKSGF
jgi:Replication protein C N-terminal domain